MAGERVNTYAQDDSDILALQLTTDKTFKGYHQLTLTEYDTTTVPAIAAGSAIECNGALYKFDTEEAISTTDPVTSAAVADGTVYVCIVPGATTATAAFTATAPTWSDSKQGWYGTGDYANYRYAEYLVTKATASYGKGLFTQNKTRIALKKTGSQNIPTTHATKVSFNSAVIDLKSEFSADTNAVTVKNSGYYLITGTIYIGNVSTDVAILMLYKNGAKYGDTIGTTSNQDNIPLNILLYLSAGDYLEVYVSSISDNNYDVGLGSLLNIVEL